MDCREIEFSSDRSVERINRAQPLFQHGLLMRLLAFTLHLLGVKRQDVAKLVDMPEESVKTIIRLVMRDGFDALRDRRRSTTPKVPQAAPDPPGITVRRDEEQIVIEFGPNQPPVVIPVAFHIQARTILLSLFNAKLLSLDKVAQVLKLHPAHCRELAKKLANNDVDQALIDKRQGLKQEYVFTPQIKSELIQQFALNVLSGFPTTGKAIAHDLQQRCEIIVSERAVRLQLGKLGLSNIVESLPKLFEDQKKTSSNS